MHHKLEKLPIYMKTSRNLYATIEPTAVEAVELGDKEIDDVIGQEAHQKCQYEDMPLCAYRVPQGMMEQIGLGDLPKGVAVVGGSARALFQAAVLGEKASIRDVDLAALEGVTPSDIDFDQLGEEYMPDDYRHGHGVQETEVDAYFATRDFTLNEVLVVDGVIISTERGYDDLKNKIIRPTEYEAEGWSTGIGPRLSMKATLLSVIYRSEYGQGRCEGFTMPSDLSEFYEALALNKAFQYGFDISRAFLEEIGYSDMSDDKIVEHAKYLADESDFEFRGSAIADLVNQGRRLTGRYYEDDDFADLPPSELAYERAIKMMGECACRMPPGVDIAEY
ncbi:hypothetical protein QQ965_00285 [Candidatus Saccharibacteria bacterium oral taxon 955]